MVQRPAWLTRSVMTVVAVLLFAACAGPAASPSTGPTAAASHTPPAATGTPGTSPSGSPATSPSGSPETSPSGSPETSPSAAPTGTAYPTGNAQPGDPTAISDSYPNYGGDVDCANHTFNGLPYTGNLKSIAAPDPMTVVFTFCNPDAAFLAQAAFGVFAINDSDYLITHSLDGTIKDAMNGTGPFKMEQWQRGTEIDFSRFDNYWGDKAVAATGVLQWAKDPTTRLQALQAGTIDGFSLVGPSDFDAVANDATLSLQKANGLNTLYLGMNHNFAPWDNPLVRQALAVGIDRQRIVDGFLPQGSEVATHFTPCGIQFGCNGDDWPAFNKQKAIDLLTQAGYGPNNPLVTTLSFRDPPSRGYMPQPTDTATDIQAQLADIGIQATLDNETTQLVPNANAGALKGLFLLGWGADYPDVTNFLDYHFGAGCTKAFGDCYPDIAAQLTTGGQTSDQSARDAAYTAANNAILADVPMVPISHAAFANAYLADVGNQEISPLSDELLFKMTPSAAHGDQIVFMQNSEPLGVYCGDESDGESLRACLQSMEALYAYKDNGTDPIPALATGCTANTDATVWTCALRSGVTFHDGSTFEAKDVIVSWAAQWDAMSPIHKGNTSLFEYWPGIFGGFLNPPAPCGISGQPACGS